MDKSILLQDKFFQPKGYSILTRGGYSFIFNDDWPTKKPYIF